MTLFHFTKSQVLHVSSLWIAVYLHEAIHVSKPLGMITIFISYDKTADYYHLTMASISERCEDQGEGTL